MLDITHDKDTFSLGNILTLPLTEEGVLHYTQLVSEFYKLSFFKSLRQNVRYLLSCGHILKLNCPSLNPIMDEVISDLNMFRPVMENWILRESNATLIIAVNLSGLNHMTK